MVNPWEEIALSDYENHMKLDSVMQLQNLNQMMKGQFSAYPVSSVIILGIAGGNGLEHIDKNKFQKAVERVQPKYVSCIIQINVDNSWISDSPYIHAFDSLDKVHTQVEEDSLIQMLKGIGYKRIAQIENPLPNGKKFNFEFSGGKK